MYGSIEHARSIAHDPHRVYFRPLSCYRNSTGNVDETSQARGTSYPRANALLNTALSLISLSLSLSQLPPSREDNFFSYLLLFPSPLSVSSTFSLSLLLSIFPTLSFVYRCFFSLFLSFPRSPRFSPFSPVSRVRRLFPSLPVEDGAPRNVIRWGQWWFHAVARGLSSVVIGIRSARVGEQASKRRRRCVTGTAREVAVGFVVKANRFDRSGKVGSSPTNVFSTYIYLYILYLVSSFIHSILSPVVIIVISQSLRYSSTSIASRTSPRSLLRPIRERVW